jgi:hypothetical protein
MSRHGYVNDYDDDNWSTIRWRGAVESAIRGKRGQALLKELETSLLALPEKKLCKNDFASEKKGQVCALGAVALKRRVDKGMSLKDAIREIEEKYPQGEEPDVISAEMNIADALLREITYVNDDGGYNNERATKRYERVLSWVQKQIVR